VSPVIVYVLTALAAVVVVLTRLRLRRRREGAGRVEIARGPVGVHNVVGVLALVTWCVFLAGGDNLSEDTASLVGIVALVLWWIVALAGLLILLRWLPARGKHAAAAVEDSWSEGPGLSILGHLGMVVGVVVFTYAYLVKAV
jgi:Kef-type K+ transport system membrane component KefB